MNVALVHDWLNQIGGAEDVLETLTNVYPDVPIYTSLYWQKKMPAQWQSWDIHTSMIDKLPLAHTRHQMYLPLYPMAFEHFDFSEYDLVISNKSGFCHGIVTEPDTLHICYCLTPTRYVWRYHQYAKQENISAPARVVLPPFISYLRQWDRVAANRVDHFIAISEEVRRRIAKIYQRDAAIIYPPVDTSRFDISNQVDDYYLLVGRLVPYRNIDILIQAFNKMGRPLLITGSGRDRERLEAMAGPTIQFLGYIPDDELPDLFARCRAFMWPGEEDFGIAPVQAMASGRPVIAYAAGGALETVIDGQTGTFFKKQTVEAIIDAVETFDTNSVDPGFLRLHAEQFDTAVFKRQMSQFVEQKMEEKQRSERLPQQ